MPWTLAALLVNFLLPVLLALGRARLLGALALPLVLIHLAATALGAALFGVDGAVGAFFVAPTCLAAVLLVAGAGRARGGPMLLRELSADAARFIRAGGDRFRRGLGDRAWRCRRASLRPWSPARSAAASTPPSCCLVARPQLEVLLGAVVVRPAPA